MPSLIRNKASLILTVIVLGFGVLSNAQEMTLAVMSLEARGISDYEAATLTDRLRNEFVKIGGYRVVERGMMEAIMQEYALYETGCTSDECLIQVGEMLGATHIVGGSVSRFGSMFTVSTRLVNVETGRLVRVYDYDFTGAIEALLTSGMLNVAQALSGLTVDLSMQTSDLDVDLPSDTIKKPSIDRRGKTTLKFRRGLILSGGKEVEREQAILIMQSIEDAEIDSLILRVHLMEQRKIKIRKVGAVPAIVGLALGIGAIMSKNQDLAGEAYGSEAISFFIGIASLVPGTRATIALKRAIKKYNQVVGEER